MTNRNLPALALLVTLYGPAAAAGESEPAQASVAQPLKQFKDWTVGCDNLRTCAALGLPPAEEPGAYVKISRTGAADDEPAVSFSTFAADETKKRPRLKVLLDGSAAPSLPAEPLSAQQDGNVVTASLSQDDARAFIAALRSAKTLTVQLIEGAAADDATTVSLAGAAAALLYMDAQQNRLGTVTALIRRGDRPALLDSRHAGAADYCRGQNERDQKARSSLPASFLRKMRVCKGDDASAFRLSSTLTLSSVCDQAAAYNFNYRFWIAGAGRAKPAIFRVPGRRWMKIRPC